MIKKYLECGKVINKRGIAGELKAECYCDSPESLFKATRLYTDEQGKNAHNVVSVKGYKGYLYIKLSDVTSAEDADAMRGKILFADRNEIIIDKDKFFISDILGLEVIDADNGRVYGKLAEVFNRGASDIYRITNGKNEYLIPAVPEIVIKATPDDCILVRPIQGMFDEAEEIR